VCRPEKKNTFPIFRICVQTRKLRNPFPYSGSVSRPENKKTFPLFRIYKQTGKQRKLFPYSGSVSRPEKRKPFPYSESVYRPEKTKKIFPIFRICEQVGKQRKPPFPYSGSPCRQKTLKLSHVQDLCADQKTLKPFSCSGPVWRPEDTETFLIIQDMCADQKN
jgi:hypothetical protein